MNGRGHINQAVAAVVTGLLISPAVIAQEPSARVQPPAPSVVSQTSAVVSLAAMDPHLLAALRAQDETGRKAALRAAQDMLDAMNVPDQPPARLAAENGGDSEPFAWLNRGERRIDVVEDQHRRDLRATLMRALWLSPYGAIPARDLDALEIVTQALRVLDEMTRIGGGDATALTGLKNTYWSWLMAHRDATGLAYTALGESEAMPVFDQRILPGEDGSVRIYQLTGDAGRMLRWWPASAEPVDTAVLTAGALRVDLDHETAPWLLILEGDGVAELLVGELQWLETIREHARLVLRPAHDFPAVFQVIPDSWFKEPAKIPYLLPGLHGTHSGRVHLVQVATRREIGAWPLAALTGPGAELLQYLIMSSLATSVPGQAHGTIGNQVGE